MELNNAITQELFDKIYNSIKSKHVKVILILSFKSGLNLGEILSLDTQSFLIKKNEIIISGKNARKIQIPIGLNKEGLNEFPILSNYKNKKCAARCIQRMIKRTLHNLKLNENISFKSFRKGFIVDLILKGYSDYSIKERMGFKTENQVQLRRKNAGIISPKLRLFILNRDNFKCVYCGRTSKTSTSHIDHIIPMAKKGKTNKNNLQTLCAECNSAKSDQIIQKVRIR